MTPEIRRKQRLTRHLPPTKVALFSQTSPERPWRQSCFYTFAAATALRSSHPSGRRQPPWILRGVLSLVSSEHTALGRKQGRQVGKSGGKRGKHKQVARLPWRTNKCGHHPGMRCEYCWPMRRGAQGLRKTIYYAKTNSACARRAHAHA